MLYPLSFRWLRRVCTTGILLLMLLPSLAFGLSANGPFFGWVSVGSECKAYSGYCELKRSRSGSWAHLKYIYPADGYSSYEIALSAGTHEFKFETYDVGPRGPILRRTETLTVVVPTTAPTVSFVTVPSTASGAIDIKWGRVIGAAEYTVQESKNNGTWRTLITGPATDFGSVNQDLMYSSTNVQPGSYRYRVKACRGTQCTAYKTSSTVTVTDPNEHPESRVIFIHTDLLGSPAAETDINGNLLQ